MRDSVYRSCSCKNCRRVSSARKRITKRMAHRAVRREAARMLRRGDDGVPAVGHGYRS